MLIDITPPDKQEFSLYMYGWQWFTIISLAYLRGVLYCKFAVFGFYQESIYTLLGGSHGKGSR